MLLALQNKCTTFTEHNVINNSILDGMFKARKSIFVDQLNWTSTKHKDYEIDEFDSNFPLYLISYDPKSMQHLASLRLLPTTGKNMLNSCFKDMFNDDVDLSSPFIIECTRFCSSGDCSDKDFKNSLVSQGISELVLGLRQICVEFGYQQVTGVFSSAMKRFYRRTGWQPDVLAQADNLQCGKVYAGLWDVSESSEEKIRSALNFYNPVEILYDSVMEERLAA